MRSRPTSTPDRELSIHRHIDEHLSGLPAAVCGQS
jgi:hypothetical protein